jgi:hypothetical protein
VPRRQSWILLLTLLPALAQVDEQSRRTPPSWPCVAGRAVDPTYVNIAEATGGQVFLFDPSEVAKSAALIIARQGHEETLFRAMGQLDGGVRDFVFPVDSSVESMVISVSIQCRQSVGVYRPNGAELSSYGAGVEDHEFRAGRILKLPFPDPGEWRIRVAGRGIFFAVANAKSDISLDRVEFVELGGRPGHEGYFPTKKPPRLGVAQMLEVSMSGPATGVNFRVVSSGGDTLQRFALERSSEALDFLGAFVPAFSSFRIVAEGFDEKGLPFQRFYGALFQTAPDSGRQQLKPGP